MTDSHTRGQKSDPTDRSRSTDTDECSNAVVTDGSGVDATDLTQFQVTILAILAEESKYGLAIKRELEAYYGEEINHGRLYPNLDDLVEQGLIAKSERDKRTNDYQLTESGWGVVHSRAAWLGSKLDLDEDHQPGNAEPARADGGERQSVGETMADAAERAGLFEDADGGDA